MIKYHKICGVPLEVCTAEQKIAYNLAFRAHITFQDDYNWNKTHVCKGELLAFISYVVDFEIRQYKRECANCNYDIDGIQSALRAGLENYLEKFTIAHDYKTIGRLFPARYLIKQ